MNAARQRLKKMEDHKMSLEQRMKDNEKELCRVESDMKTQLSQADRPPEVADLIFLLSRSVAFLFPSSNCVV